MRAALAVERHSRAGIVGVETSGSIRSWSPGAESTLGRPADHAVGRSIFDLVPPESHDLIATCLAEVHRGRSVNIPSLEMTTPAGATAELTVDFWPARDRDGGVIGAATMWSPASGSDIPDVAAARAGYWAWVRIGDEERLWRSPKARALLGVSEQELEAQGVAAMLSNVHPDDRAAVSAAWTLAVEGDAPFDVDSRILAERGTVWVRFRSDLRAVGTAADGRRLLQLFGLVRDVTNERRYEHLYLEQASRDPLTELADRQAVIDYIDRAVLPVTGTAVVVSVDIDNFHMVNQQFGGEAGDGLLVAFARRLSSAFGSTHRVARSGADEFLVVGEGDGRDDDERLVLQVQRTLAEPFTIKGTEAFVTVSIGFSVGGGRGEALVAEADNALHRAKRRGSARVEKGNDGRSADGELATNQATLRRAVLARELVLDYQPLVDPATGRITASEALARWPTWAADRPWSASAGRPASFIRMAEETGLIVPLGDQMLRMAANQVATWEREGPGLPAGFTVGVNVSARQLERPGLIDDVAAAVADAGIPASRLVLEITETELMLDIERAIAALQSLRRIGVRLSVDDFGTGHSSLTYLRRLPVSELKIDQSFVSRLPDAKDQALVETIVSLGRTFGLDVVAEGIETPAQAEAIRRAGCTRAQGYYYHRPMRPEELGRLLRVGS